MEAVIKAKSPSITHVIGGSLFIALCAQIAIPLGPVPFTMQTLALFLLSLSQGSRLATLSVMLYLIEVSAGLPFLAGGASNPLCLIGPRAGYLIAFPITTLLAGYLFEKGRPLMALVCGNVLILAFGVSVLSFTIGLEQAIMWGALPFLPSAVCKGVALLFAKEKFSL